MGVAIMAISHGIPWGSLGYMAIYGYGHGHGHIIYGAIYGAIYTIYASNAYLSNIDIYIYTYHTYIYIYHIECNIGTPSTLCTTRISPGSDLLPFHRSHRMEVVASSPPQAFSAAAAPASPSRRAPTRNGRPLETGVH